LLRISTLIVFAGSYFINIATFRNLGDIFSSGSPGALWTLNFVFAAAFVIIYFVFQLFMVFTQLEDHWLAGIVYLM
jgi:glucan phosphoethanolaminetransferase (alkaline phosphatase superfamily)